MNATTAPTIETLYAVGHWLLEQGRAADATDVFKTMMLAAPEDERSWLGLGACEEALERADIAARLYELAEAAVPTPSLCMLARARLLVRGGDTDAAGDLYSRAAEVATERGDEDLAAAIASEGGVS